MEFYKIQLYNSRKEHTFLYKPKYVITSKLNESDETYVPRFTIKNDEIFKDFPTNTPTKVSLDLISKAIEYGMILQIDYKGDEDDNFSGHERVIYPMVLGQNKDGKYLIRGYHLKGWSVSGGGNVEKEWRMFRADRILNMIFTGAFYRLAPDGYNSTGDKGISKILKQADFNSIRNNQQKLLQKNEIDLQDRVVLSKIKQIDTKDLNYNLKIFDPWESNIIPRKDAKNIRITFAKPVIGSGQWIAIIGTSIKEGNIFKIKTDKESDLGSYKSVRWVMANELDNISSIQQQVEFKTLLFLKGN